MKLRNVGLWCAVILLVALPLWLIPNTDGEPFSGSDSQAQQLITDIAPGYEPWAEPPFQPPGSEIESLLFALQAALGAGFIGYWLGVSVSREKNWRAAADYQKRQPPKC